jgi:hypothetical protein
MFRAILFVQVLFFAAFGVAYALRPATTDHDVVRAVTGKDVLPAVVVPRREPLTIAPLHDRADLPQIVSEEELAYVLKRIRPKLPKKELRPNLVEHALRTWDVHAKFADSEVLSGADLAAFLTNHVRFIESWGDKAEPLLQEKSEGIAIRWGHFSEASVHHDHWLASLTEAGVTLDTPVYGPSRHDSTIEDVLRESLRDFHLDEREAEWTAMAFGLWLPPTHEWIGAGGRRYSFDLIARRLMRGHGEKGVCSGTHRVYSLVLLLRLDDQFDEVLSDSVCEDVNQHVCWVRDQIQAAQLPDGHWPGNWPDGADAVAEPREDPLSTKIIATGHHLEWQAIAPAHLRLSDEQNRKAVEWLLTTMRGMSDQEIIRNYTFCTHVGNAFAMWRKTRPTPFWADWTARHPGYELSPEPPLSVQGDDKVAQEP